MHFVINLGSISVETLSCRILIVDDDPHVLKAVSSYLEIQGFNSVRRAPSGPDAVLIAQEFRPHVVFLDYLMPALKGDDTAKLLKRVVPETKVIAFSAVLNERPDWADAYLPKSKLSDAAQLIDSLRVSRDEELTAGS